MYICFSLDILQKSMVDLMGQAFTTQINYIPSATCGLRYISTLEF